MAIAWRYISQACAVCPLLTCAGPLSTARRRNTTMCLFGFAGAAGIWNAATLPEARGHGYGSMMTLAAAQAVLALGYHYGVLLVSPAGVGLYRRLGFQEICHIDVYRSGG